MALPALAALSSLSGGGALSGLNSRTGDVTTGATNIGGLELGGGSPGYAKLGLALAAGVVLALLVRR